MININLLKGQIWPKVLGQVQISNNYFWGVKHTIVAIVLLPQQWLKAITLGLSAEGSVEKHNINMWDNLGQLWPLWKRLCQKFSKCVCKNLKNKTLKRFLSIKNMHEGGLIIRSRWSLTSNVPSRTINQCPNWYNMGNMH